MKKWKKPSCGIGMIQTQVKNRSKFSLHERSLLFLLVTCRWVCSHQEGSAGSWYKRCSCKLLVLVSPDVICSVWAVDQLQPHCRGYTLIVGVHVLLLPFHPRQRQCWVKANSVLPALCNIPKECPLFPLIYILCNTVHFLLRSVSGLSSELS